MQLNEINPTKTAMIVVDMQNDFVLSALPWKHPLHVRWCRSLLKP
jgi:hypothetical protein